MLTRVKMASCASLLFSLIACNQHDRMKLKAQLGPTKSMREYGMWLCRQPNSGQADLDEGLAWIRKAAEKGDPEAMFEMGRTYELGLRNTPEALYWFRKGAEAGDFASMTKLIEIYTYGYGYPKDPVEAQKWTDAAYSTYMAKEHPNQPGRK